MPNEQLEFKSQLTRFRKKKKKGDDEIRRITSGVTLKRGVGQLETTMSSQGSIHRRAGVQVFQHATEHENHNWFGELPFHGEKHHHRRQAHKHVRKRGQDVRSRINRTHRIGAMPQSHLGLCRAQVGPGKDTLRREAVGGPQQASHATPKRQDQGNSPTPWLPEESKFRSRLHQ